MLGFCQQRGLSTEGIRIIQRMYSNPSQFPASFPEKYKDAVIRSAELCAVKKHFEEPPQFEVTTKTV